MITGYLNVIPDVRVCNIISKGPKYRFPSNIDFPKCRKEIAACLNDFSYRWCKRENVEPDALKKWKIYIFKIIDTSISFYSHNTHLLPPKPKSSITQLKRGIQDFGVKAKEIQDKVPTLYWLPKLHKNPYKAKFNANSSACTTTELS